MGMDLHGTSGNYFHANVWSWRPIHSIVEELNDTHNLGLNLGLWGSNDGAGLHTQADCDRLAQALESHVSKWPDGHVYYMESDVRIATDGSLMSLGQSGGVSAYSVEKEHVQEFIDFLRECGGEFTID